jgi:hypothetical protein
MNFLFSVYQYKKTYLVCQLNIEPENIFLMVTFIDEAIRSLASCLTSLTTTC